MTFDLKLKNGDLTLQNGDLQTVVDSEKLIQDILKIALTQAGSNPMQPWYGSFISRSMIGTSLPTKVTLTVAQAQLQNAIENLMSVQVQQIKSFQQVTPDEQIAAIQSISITRDTSDPRLFRVAITVITRGFKPVSTEFLVSPI